MKNKLVLSMERMGLENWGREGAEVMKLEVTLLACKPLSSAVLLTARAEEGVRKSNLCDRMLGVGVVKELFSA